MQIIARNDDHRLVHMKVGIIGAPVWRIERRTSTGWGGTEVFCVRWKAEKAAKEIGLDLADDAEEAGDE